MHVLDADNLLPELDAAKFSASKVTQDPATIVKKKAKINKGIYAVKLNGSFEFTQTVTKDWMQHHYLHPKCFKCLQISCNP